MKTIGYSLTLALSLCVSPAAGEAIQWVHDLRAAMGLAANSGRPVVVHFYADWCGPCARLDQVVFRDPHFVKAVNEQAIAVKVDVDRHPDLATRFGISAVPSDVYLSPAGGFIARQTSPHTAVEYRVLLQRLAAHVRARAADRRASDPNRVMLELGPPQTRAGNWLENPTSQ